jgi:hypothetical protein
MDPQSLISILRHGRGEEAGTLEEYFQKNGPEAWGRVCDVARSRPEAVGDDVVEWLSSRLAEGTASFFCLLIQLAARDVKRRSRMIELFERFLPLYPRDALQMAGYHLHEHQAMLDSRWLDLALRHVDANPEGAWGVVESAAMYHPELVRPEILEAFEARRAAAPEDYFVTLLSLASHRPHERREHLDRALRAFPEHPPEAITAASQTASSKSELLVPELVDLVLRHFDANAEKAWEFFERAVQTEPGLFDDELLDTLSARVANDPSKLLTILRSRMDSDPDRVGQLMDRFVALVRRFPKEGIESVKYRFQGESLSLLRPELVRAVCEGFPTNAYPAYDLLRRCALRRPELIGRPEVEAALRNIRHATNWAFGFFQELLKLRPEFTGECTLALFECLAEEPVHRAFVRAEEMGAIMAISEAAHIKTGLEKALREPPRVGSRRARALMAIMFRQKLRARRHVLLEALRYAAEVVLWRKVPGQEDSEKFSPIWEFIFFIIDQAADDAISTAAAERFLEGAFQLRYLCETRAEHEDFLRKLDLGQPGREPFPECARFLEADRELAALYGLVRELGRRFGTEPRLAPLEAFERRGESARSELEVLERSPDGPGADRRRERIRHLKFQEACWADPGYQRALRDASLEAELPAEARAFLRREKKDLAKHLRDVLRSEAIRIAVAAVEKSRMDLYRHRLKGVLGRDVDLERVEPKILPSFLWFQALGAHPKNARGLKRLIEDRLEGRSHDWLRTEPAARTWAERVRAGQPGIRLERWRAPFSRDVQYRPKDAIAEKRRRIKADLAQARALLEKAGATGIPSDRHEDLVTALGGLLATPTEETSRKEPPAKRPDPALLEEIRMNLERVRLAELTPDSDFEGKVELSVESDPFEILFMGEYGFASCLSLRGSNAWSAVSNAIDIDKTIVWAREPGGNVVGRRLLALMPEGVVMFRTYTNRHGLALDRAFDEFVVAYAAHCGTAVAHGGHPGPLLSDRWYDDGAL